LIGSQYAQRFSAVRSMSSSGGLRLFALDRRNPGMPELLPGLPQSHSVTGADWSADGTQIVFSSQMQPDPNSVRIPSEQP
jgi:hypothetical protein